MTVNLNRIILCAAGVLWIDAASVSADSGKPKEDQYGWALSHCELGCYELGDMPKKEEPRKICGYQDYLVTQDGTKSAWNPIEVGVPVNEPKELEPCKLPKASSGGKWKPLIASLKKEFPGMAKGDVLVVEKGEDWHNEKLVAEDRTGDRVTIARRRAITVRLYSKQYEIRANECGVTTPNAVCEWSSTGRGGALGLNIARFRLNQAKELAGKNDEHCRTAAWHAVGLARALPELRAARKKENNWPDDRKYVTRWDGTLNDKQLFDTMGKIEKEASALYLKCKGTKAGLATADDNDVLSP
jgi:hypothetical protein